VHRRLHRGFLDRHLIRVPLSQGVLVAAQDRGALPVEEHPIDHGTRKHPDKTDLLVLDVVGGSTMHSLVTLPSLFGIDHQEFPALGDGTRDLTDVGWSGQRDADLGTGVGGRIRISILRELRKQAKFRRRNRSASFSSLSMNSYLRVTCRLLVTLPDC
jgi:hypothetical protein